MLEHYLQHNNPPHPWHTISVDLLEPLSKSKEHNTITVITDKFSKMIRLIPTTSEISAIGMAKLYQDHIWKIHGLPRIIISDRGPQFAAAMTRDLCESLGIKRNLSSAYHPRTDGQTERSHQETETFLRHYINHHQNDWSEWLAIAEFQYNDKAHSATGHSPFYIMQGQHPWKVLS